MLKHLKYINKLVNKRIATIESCITKSDAIFLDEINTIVKH